ncbi:MAG: glucose-1-phosphate adenylyltransferase subunit GlgD [Gemmatimonadetes bacterium]|nr:MAG: glucose-1-phosphate adenylyltransferase subunit GlgD [Gemmatimonadota bacterium]
MGNVIAMILAGGKADRLSVISKERAKSAVPFGGKYRIIDFALSNCVNSNIYTVGVLTQYLPRSLNKHIGTGIPWDLNRRWGGVKLLPPYIQRSNTEWYLGTADALGQNIDFMDHYNPELVLVLSGDHVYKMDYRQLIAFHKAKNADITLSLSPVPAEQMDRVGTVEVDTNDRIITFQEKVLQAKSNLASMGIYLFDYSFLKAQLQRQNVFDIVRHIIINGLQQHRIFGYRFDGYWRDIGTIQCYYDANMELLTDPPALILDERNRVIHTQSEERPPVKFGANADVVNSVLSNGGIVNGRVIRSVLSPGVVVEDGAIVQDAIIFNDTRIRRGAKVDRAILDKNVVVEEGCVVGEGDDFTGSQKHRDLISGITLIGKGTVLPPNYRLGRNCILDIHLRPEDLPGDALQSGSYVENRHDPD